MPEEQDLIGKLDALLNKHRNPAGGENLDEIPVLTNIVESPEPSASSLATAHAANSVNSPGLSDSQIESLTREIFEHVMSKLGSQISNDLQVQLIERLSSIIDNTVATAISDFKQGLADLVGDAIAEVLLDRAERNSGSPAQGEPDKTSH